MKINEELLKYQDNFSILGLDVVIVMSVSLLLWGAFAVFTVCKWMNTETTTEADIFYWKEIIKNSEDEPNYTNLNILIDEKNKIIDKKEIEKKLKKAEKVNSLLSNGFLSVTYLVFCISIFILILSYFIMGTNDHNNEVSNIQEEKLIEIVSLNTEKIDVEYIESVGINKYKLGFYDEGEYKELPYNGNIKFEEEKIIKFKKMDKITKKDLKGTRLGEKYYTADNLKELNNKINNKSILYVGKIYKKDLIENGKISLIESE